MTSIQTANGHIVDLSNPRLCQIVIADVAHHLSLINRFSGATRRPYSVAEHSLLVAEIVEIEFGADIHGQLAALLHDAHEAWLGDVSTPLKSVLGQGWSGLEDRWERLVRDAFGIRRAHARWRDEIKQADLMALATERRDLLLPTGDRWPVLDGIQPVDWVDLADHSRAALHWLDWRQAVIDRYDSLDYARNDLARELDAPAGVH